MVGTTFASLVGLPDRVAALENAQSGLEVQDGGARMTEREYIRSMAREIGVLREQDALVGLLNAAAEAKGYDTPYDAVLAAPDRSIPEAEARTSLYCRLFGHKFGVKGMDGKFEWCSACGRQRDAR